MAYLLILGTGGLAREIAMVAKAMLSQNPTMWDDVGFVCQSEEEVGKDLGVGTILGTDDWAMKNKFKADLVVGIGQPKIKAMVVDSYLAIESRFSWPNIIHPAASIDKNLVSIGRGNVITAGCIFTCDISVGNFNLFNLNTTIGHDAKIGDFNVINPSCNISGNVEIGDRVLCGTGCQILETINIGSDATVGAGAVVTKNVPNGITVVGVPAKRFLNK